MASRRPPQIVVPAFTDHFAIQIRSEDRTVGSASDFSVRVRTEPQFEVGRVRVKTVQIPHSFYVVNVFTNKIVFKVDAGGDLTATIAVGNYDDGSYATAVIAALIAAKPASTWTMVFDEITHKYTITITSGGALFELRLKNDLFSAKKELGFLGKLDTGLAASHVSNSVVDLSGPRFIDVRSGKITGGWNTTFGEISDVLVRVPVGTLAFELINYEPEDPRAEFVHDQTLDNFDLRLVAEGQTTALDLNGGEWNITLIVEKII